MDNRDALINKLRSLVAKQAAQLEKQAARIAELELAFAKFLRNSSTYFLNELGWPPLQLQGD